MSSPDVVRAAFVKASEHFVATCALVPVDRWDEPALGEWSTRDLIGHASRSMLTIEEYLPKGGDRIDLVDSVGYFRAALGSITDESAVAERGRLAGAALGDDPPAAVRSMAFRVVPLVERSPDDAVVGTPWGGMRLIDYLPTRIFELSIHTLDLAAALCVETRLPEPASMVAWELVALLVRWDGNENDLLRAVTGRIALPGKYNVLALDSEKFVR